MDYSEKDFGKILKKNALNIRRLVLQDDTECMRVYDRNLEEFPVSVDLYGKFARITDYSLNGLDEDIIATCCDIVRRMCYIQADHVIFHRRSKIGKEQHEILSEQSLLVEVKESGHTFTVDLTKRIDTGLFLDHMRTRQMVQQMSRKLRVLNLFSYTGAFSVYAAAGGAMKVDSVDLSSTYTEWAKDNLLKNGFEGENYNCIATDALKFIIESVKEGRKYDLVIFDPPSFSNSRKMDDKFDVSKDYVRYFNLINNLLEENGILIFSTNLSSFHMDTGRVRGFKVTQITKDVTAPGFTKAKGTSRTWLLTWTNHLRLQKRDYEGRLGIQKAKDPDYIDWQEDKEKPNMDILNENKEEEVVETLANTEDQTVENNVENTTEDAKETAVADDAADTAIEEVEEKASEEDTNDFEKIIATLEEDEIPSTEEVSNEDGMLTLDWDDSEVVAPTVRTKSKPRAVTSLADRKLNNREENTESSDSYKSDRRDSRGGRGDDRRSGRRDESRSSYGRDNNRDRKPSYGRDNDRDRRPSFGRDNDRDRRPSFGRDNDRDRRPSYGRDNDRDRRPSYGRDNDRDRRPSYGRDNDRDRRPSFGRDNDRDRRPSFGRDNDRDRRPSFGRDNDRDRRPSYGRDNDRDRKPSFGRDNDRDRRPSYGRDNDRDRRPSFGRDNDRDRRPSYGRDNDRDRRPSFGRDNDRDRRPSFGRDNDRDRKPSYGRDNDRKSFSRDDRKDGDRGGRSFNRDDRRGPSRDSQAPRRGGNGPKPYGFDNVKQTRTRGEDEGGFFWLSNNDKKDK